MILYYRTIDRKSAIIRGKRANLRWRVMVKVKELSVEQLKALIQEAVEEKLQEVLGDPDQGLELKEDIKERLRRSLAAVESGNEGIPVRQVVKEVGLRWE